MDPILEALKPPFVMPLTMLLGYLDQNTQPATAATKRGVKKKKLTEQILNARPLFNALNEAIRNASETKFSVPYASSSL